MLKLIQIFFLLVCLCLTCTALAAEQPMWPKNGRFSIQVITVTAP